MDHCTTCLHRQTCPCGASSSKMTVMAAQMTPGSARMLRQQAPTAMQVHRAGCRLQPSVHRLHRRTQRTIVRAAETQDKQAEKKEKLVENFKKGGLDKSTAQRVLDMWKQTGASDEEGLKKLLVRRSLTQALTIVIQTGLDAGAHMAPSVSRDSWAQPRASRCTTSGALAPHFWAATSVPVSYSTCSRWAR